MVPFKGEFLSELEALVAEGRVPESRLDESVASILALKYRLGLLGSFVEGAPCAVDPGNLTPLPPSLVRSHNANFEPMHITLYTKN